MEPNSSPNVKPRYMAQSSISSAPLSLSESKSDHLEMEQTEKESVRAASEEVSGEFKTLVNAEDLDSLKQLQHLMYISLSMDYNMFVELSSKHYQNWILLLVLLIMLLPNLYNFL
jgi:hypothetical protein